MGESTVKLVDIIKERKQGTLEKNYPEVVKWFESEEFLGKLIYNHEVHFEYFHHGLRGKNYYPCFTKSGEAVPPNLIVTYLEEQGFKCEIISNIIIVELKGENND